jgi:hypothetical protein
LRKDRLEIVDGLKRMPPRHGGDGRRHGPNPADGSCTGSFG